jgi:hypothetical protein
MNTLMTIAWAIIGAVLTWGLMLVHASAAIARLDAHWRKEVRHWQAETARARAYAAQLAQPAVTSGYKPGYQQGREYVVMTVPLLVPARGPLIEQHRAAVDITDRT